MNWIHLIDVLLATGVALWCLFLIGWMAVAAPLLVTIVVGLVLLAGAVAAIEEARESWREARRG